MSAINVVKALLIYFDQGTPFFLELIRSHKKIVAPGMGDLPGGKVDAGESLETALMREIKEETGIIVEVVHTIADYRWTHGGHTYHEHLYYAFVSTQKVTLAPEEHESYQWIPLAQIHASSLHSSIKNIVENNKEKILTIQC